MLVGQRLALLALSCAAGPCNRQPVNAATPLPSHLSLPPSSLLLQLQRATHDLNDAQRDLHVARSRAEGAMKAGEAARAEAAQKLQKQEEEVGGWCKCVWRLLGCVRVPC